MNRAAIWILPILLICPLLLGQKFQQKLGWNLEQLRQASPQQQIKIHEAMEEGELLQERDEYESIRTRSANGRPPSAGQLAAARLAIASWKSAALTHKIVAGIRIGNPPLPLAANLGASAQNRWQSIGPVNVPGRTRAVAFIDKNPNNLLVGSVSGGLWRSKNGGRTFHSVNEYMKTLAISCIAVNPGYANIIFAGTGEGNGNADAMTGDGIYATHDGSTWSRLPGTNSARFEFVNRIAFSADGNTVLVAAQPRTATGHKGIYRSSVPADGASWSWVQVSSEDIVDVQFDPKDPNKAVASTLSSGAAFYSKDAGKTWTQASHLLNWNGEIEVTYAAADSNIVYASVSSTSGDTSNHPANLQNALAEGAIWKSTDGGKSYSLPGNANLGGTIGGYLGNIGYYANTIWAGDPTDPNLVVVGGFELWRSTDGGNHITPISSFLENSFLHCDQHTIVSSPAYDGKQNRRVLIGNDGGVAEAQDIRTVLFTERSMVSSNWNKLSTGYGTTQFYGAAYSPMLDKVLGGTQDNGTVMYDLKSTTGVWNIFALGDGGFCAADPKSKTLYGEQEFGNIMRSDDGGSYSMYISGQYQDRSTGQWTWRSPPNVIEDAENGHIGFVAPFVLDPNNSKRLLVGGYSVWQTNDPDAPFNPGPRWASIGPRGTQTCISAIAVQPGNSAVTWVGYQDGSICRSANSTSATPTWRHIVLPTGIQSRMCTRIVFDPSSPGSVLVGFGGFVPGNLWRCSAGGGWTNLSTGKYSLPAAPLDALTIHPDHPNFIYAGTDVGLFVSPDSGKSWWPAGPDTCRVNDLVWAGKKLILTTHGTGMYILDLASVSPPMIH